MFFGSLYTNSHVWNWNSEDFQGFPRISEDFWAVKSDLRESQISTGSWYLKSLKYIMSGSTFVTDVKCLESSARLLLIWNWISEDFPRIPRIFRGSPWRFFFKLALRWMPVENISVKKSNQNNNSSTEKIWIYSKIFFSLDFITFWISEPRKILGILGIPSPAFRGH